MMEEEIKQKAEKAFDDGNFGWFCGGHGTPSLSGREFFNAGYLSGFKEGIRKEKDLTKSLLDE